jgi:leucyl-tRNA synthetase
MMTDKYDPREIEARWQARWEADGLYRAQIDHSRPKYYALTMLPYPSGDLHMGHWYAMSPSDARARYMRMKGYNVLFPMGFDAFGLPAENAAIKRRIHPKTWTYANIARMRAQLRSMGAMFDWEREAISSDPEYYRWTQWFFLQFYKHGLAYRAMGAVDFCPTCNTTLAREQVWGDDRHCERCGTPVIKKDLEQWFFRITRYAEELLDHSRIDWPERVVTMQKNWIGRSEGAHVTFHTETEDPIEIFTTRPDTLWGATFMVLAPEHPLVKKVTTPDRRAEVEAYVAAAARKSEIDRTAEGKEKTGVFTGGYAINPVNGERIPIWVADYVLITYGSGAIMAVPAHDQRDFEFARKYGLEVRVVIQPAGETLDGATMTAAMPGAGVMVNSGPFDGTPATEEKGAANPAIKAVTEWLEQKKIGHAAVNYRLRDWLISRQRYWGAPIPIVYCPKCGTVPVPEEDLPVLLPDDVEFMPTGESPLKFHDGFRKTTCPACGGPAERETDTMDTFMCSSWYQYRYLSPSYAEGPFDPEEAAYWLPVDLYTGGIEHATMHLMYTRFFTKAMRDCGVFAETIKEMRRAGRAPNALFDEPMSALHNQGMILGEDREKMSKSRGNVVAPDDLVHQYGADAVRAYLMFGFRWDQGGPWDSQGIQGPVRWLNDVWTLFAAPVSAPSRSADESAADDLRRKVHQTIKRVTDGMETFSFNTAIAALMTLKNILQDARQTLAGSAAWDEARSIYLRLMAPFTPHIAEELWARSGYPYSVHTQPWPEHDPAIAAEDMITLVVQVNGKVRDRVQVPADISEDEAKAAALATAGAQRHLDGRPPKKVIYVPKTGMVNIVV